MYGEHAYMWAVAELLRKLLLTSLIMLFFESGSALQITFAMLVSAFAHVAHALWKPYVSRRAYLLQHASLAVTTVTYVRPCTRRVWQHYSPSLLPTAPTPRYAFGLLFKVRGFSSETDDGAGASTTAGDAASGVFRGLGVMLVVSCSLFLACGALLVAMSVFAWARHTVKRGNDTEVVRQRVLRAHERRRRTRQGRMPTGGAGHHPRQATRLPDVGRGQSSQGASVGSPTAQGPTVEPQRWTANPMVKQAPRGNGSLPSSLLRGGGEERLEAPKELGLVLDKRTVVVSLTHTAAMASRLRTLRHGDAGGGTGHTSATALRGGRGRDRARNRRGATRRHRVRGRNVQLSAASAGVIDGVPSSVAR